MITNNLHSVYNWHPFSFLCYVLLFNPLMHNICTPPLMRNMGLKRPAFISNGISCWLSFSLFYLLKSVYFMIEYSKYSLNILLFITTDHYFYFSYHTLWNNIVSILLHQVYTHGSKMTHLSKCDLKLNYLIL